MEDKNNNGIDDSHESIICTISALSPLALLIIWLVSMGIYLLAPLDEHKLNTVRSSGDALLAAALALVGNGRQKRNGNQPS